jgi:HD-GYP domain-containing protein (c-di-GMP phosphodiesterase class II)
MSNCSLYSREHLMVTRAIERGLEVLRELPDERLEIMVVDGNLVLNGKPLQKKEMHSLTTVRRLTRRGLSWVTFEKEATAEEIAQFVHDAVTGEGPPKDIPHVRMGTVAVRRGGGDEEEAIDFGAYEDLSKEQIARVKEVYAGLTPFSRLEVGGLEEVVASFLVALRQEANLLKLLTPVKDYSEYTYTHATNVALISLFQAEALGVSDELLYDVGIAALMHDVGKLFISKEVLHKKGTLEKEEFEEMKRHPTYGAYYLVGVKGLTPLAPIAAYEHHRKFDGSGYPALGKVLKSQHPVSQIVAMADFFDALRSNRPYREGWSVKKILTVMKENAGRDFNPPLLARFETALLNVIGSGNDV